MFLSGIKYQLEGNEVTTAFKFQAIESKFRNILCHHQTEQDYLLEAIVFAITGRHISNVKVAILYVADCDGNQWIIERSHQGSRFSFNRQMVENGEEKFKEAVLEGEDDLTAALVDVIRIKQDGEHLLGERVKKGSQFLQHFNQVAAHKLEQSLQKCQSFLSSPHIIALNQLVSFSHKAQFILKDYEYVKGMIANTKKEYESLAKFDPNYLLDLQKEIEILREIERDAVFFNDPANNYDVLKQKVQKIDHNLMKLCDRYEIHQLPMLDSEISWEDVVKSLSRLQAYEKLELAYRRGNHELESLVKPIFQDHIRNTKSFLLDDKKLLENIEGALKSITDITQSINSQSQIKPKTSLWKRLIDNEDKGDAPLLDVAFLEDSRQAVNRILRSINEMCSNIEVTNQSYTDYVDEIQVRYEKIVAELGKAKSHWIAIASRYKLDPQASLNSILNLINNLGQISSLYVARKECRDKLAVYSLNLKNIERLVNEWRIVTKSQKSIDLKQPSILIAEVRNILSYKDKKEGQLSKLSRVQNKIEFYHYLQSTFRGKVKECTHMWNQHFTLLGIEALGFEEKKWDQLFEMIDKCEVLSQLIRDVDRPVSDEEIFSQRNISCPLSILVVQNNLEKSSKIELLRLLDYCAPKENILLITEDSQLVRLLETKQIGVSRPIKLRKSNQNQPDLDNKKSSVPVMSEKARAALELFKARNSNASS